MCCLSTQAESPQSHEAKIIALTLLGEARGEGEIGMYAVACVIKQRSLDRNLSLLKVCLERKQFSCWNSKRNLDSLLKSTSAPYAVGLANHLAGGGGVQRSYVKYANHYCTLKTKPYWAFKTVVKDGKKIKIPINPVKIINNHKFFKIK